MYPGISFYDNDGQPLIKAYDVNSLYPSIMINVLPVGIPIKYDMDYPITDYGKRNQI